MALKNLCSSVLVQGTQSLVCAALGMSFMAAPAMAWDAADQNNLANPNTDTADWSEDDSMSVLATLGPFLSENDVRYYVRNAGFPERLVETLVDIAYCESSFGINSYAWGGGNRHTGLFQISDLHRSACGYGQHSIDSFRNSMTDPARNTQCAYTVYVNAGYSLTPWDCY